MILFDLDGTLVESSKKINIEMHKYLEQLKDKNYMLGIVGGGTFDKIIYQLDKSKYLFDYIFSECGSIIHKLQKGKSCTQSSYLDQSIQNKSMSSSLQFESNIAYMDVLPSNCNYFENLKHLSRNIVNMSSSTQLYVNNRNLTGNSTASYRENES